MESKQFSDNTESVAVATRSA